MRITYDCTREHPWHYPLGLMNPNTLQEVRLERIVNNKHCKLVIYFTHYDGKGIPSATICRDLKRGQYNSPRVLINIETSCDVENDVNKIISYINVGKLDRILEWAIANF